MALTAAEHIRDSYLLSGELVRTGSSAIAAATLQPANADQIVSLNRFLQHEIERDRAEDWGTHKETLGKLARAVYEAHQAQAAK